MENPGSAAKVEMVRDRSGWLVRRIPEMESQWRAEGAWSGLTLVDRARTLAAEAPDHVSLIDRHVSVTARELFDKASQAAGALIASGLRPGEVVSLQLPNWWEACVINLAAAMAGLLVNPIIPIYRGSELVHILTDSTSRMIFVPASFRNFDYPQMLREILPQLDNPPEVVVLRGNAGEFTSYDDFLARDTQQRDFPDTDASDVMMVLYTSGTTGPSKGVLLTHESGDIMGRDYERAWGPWEGETIIVPSPMTHITGAVQVLYMPIQCRATVAMMDEWDPEWALDLIKTHQGTFFSGAPPFVQGLLAVAKERGEHLPSLRIVGCGGASVPPGLLQDCYDQFPNAMVYRGYGCTEVPMITEGTKRRDQIDYGTNTDGLLGATRVRLVRPGTDEEVAEGEEGEILALGAQMMVGYSQPENNTDVFTSDGYFRTGDLGRIADGFLTITGRLKDIIIRNGENLSPKEIEDALDDMAAISEVAVIGLPSQRTGESVCAVVVPCGTEEPALSDLARHLEAKGLARQKQPEQLVIMRDLPRNFAGKVQKDVLRQQIMEKLGASLDARSEGHARIIGMQE